ncbi:MAG: T9SS type A sorting domain-containing protein [bacterium]
MKKLYLFVCILIVTTLNLNSKESNVNDLPELLNMSNMGKEFYFTFIPGWQSAEGDLKIYVTSDVETLVRVEVEGKGYSKELKIIPNKITEFSLHIGIGQPYKQNIIEQPKPDTVWKGAAVHVRADNPFICYAVTHFDYNSDGFVVLPVNILGKEYIVSSYQDDSDNSTNWKPGYTGITAAYDKTKVYFTMGGNDSSMTAGGLLPGQTSTYDLDKGDVLLIASSGTGSDLTGSRINASKPISVVSGNFCAAIPEGSACNFIQEMELPTHFWGVHYHVTPIIGRSQNSLIRIFAKEAKTKIFRDGKQIGYFRIAGEINGNHWLEMRADTGLPRPVVISGDKPIGITQYNTGENDGSNNIPFQMTLIPIEQYSEEITLHTPGIVGGIGFTQNYVNLIFEVNENDSIPDDLEFAQLTAGKFEWIRLNEVSPNPGKYFAFNATGKKYFCKTLFLPGDGVYKMRSNTPMGAYMYGFSSFKSYGFRVSGRLIEIQKVDTLPPEPVWVLYCDGMVNIQRTKYVTDKPDDEENRSNMSCIYLHTDASYNYKLYYGDFMPCEVQTVPWRLEIIDNREDAYGVVTFSDCAGNDTTVYILFSLPKLAYSEDKILFENCKPDSLYEALVYLKNLSTSGKSNIRTIGLIDSINGFTVLDTNHNEIALPLEIPIGDSLALLVQFRTSIEGKFADTLYAYSPCSYYFKIPVIAYTEGTGINEELLCNIVTIIPNPATDNLIISSDYMITDIKIFDLLGFEKVCPSDISEGRSIVNTSELTEGIYFLKISLIDKIIFKKFIIRR